MIISAIVMLASIKNKLEKAMQEIKEYENKLDEKIQINGQEYETTKQYELLKDIEDLATICLHCGNKLLKTDCFCQKCGLITEEEKRREYDRFNEIKNKKR